jgi:hypothetical protein
MVNCEITGPKSTGWQEFVKEIFLVAAASLSCRALRALIQQDSQATFTRFTRPRFAFPMNLQCRLQVLRKELL